MKYSDYSLTHTHTHAHTHTCPYTTGYWREKKAQRSTGDEWDFIYWYEKCYTRNSSQFHLVVLVHSVFAFLFASWHFAIVCAEVCTAQNWKWASDHLLLLLLSFFFRCCIFIFFNAFHFVYIFLSFIRAHSLIFSDSFSFCSQVCLCVCVLARDADEAIVLISNLFALSCSYYLCGSFFVVVKIYLRNANVSIVDIIDNHLLT